MKAKRYMKPPSCRKPATVIVPYAGPALDGQKPTRTISELRILSVNPGRKSWEGTKGSISPCPSRVRLVLLTVRRSLPIYPDKRTISAFVSMSQTCQQRKSRLFDHLVATGEHLAAMVIRAARLAAILLRIAKGLRPA